MKEEDTLRVDRDFVGDKVHGQGTVRRQRITKVSLGQKTHPYLLNAQASENINLDS